MPYLCSCWTSVGHFCGSKMLKSVKRPKVSLKQQLICLLTSYRSTKTSQTGRTSLSIIRITTKLYVFIVLGIQRASCSPVSSWMCSSVSISGLMEHLITFTDLSCSSQRVSHWHHEHCLCTLGHMFFSFATFQLLDVCQV